MPGKKKKTKVMHSFIEYQYLVGAMALLALIIGISGMNANRHQDVRLAYIQQQVGDTILNSPVRFDGRETGDERRGESPVWSVASSENLVCGEQIPGGQIQIFDGMATEDILALQEMMETLQYYQAEIDGQWSQMFFAAMWGIASEFEYGYDNPNWDGSGAGSSGFWGNNGSYYLTQQVWDTICESVSNFPDGPIIPLGYDYEEPLACDDVDFANTAEVLSLMNELGHIDSYAITGGLESPIHEAEYLNDIVYVLVDTPVDTPPGFPSYPGKIRLVDVSQKDNPVLLTGFKDIYSSVVITNDLYEGIGGRNFAIDVRDAGNGTEQIALANGVDGISLIGRNSGGGLYEMSDISINPWFPSGDIEVARDVAFAGDYLYVVNEESKVMVIDVSTPQNMQVVFDFDQTTGLFDILTPESESLYSENSIEPQWNVRMALSPDANRLFVLNNLNTSSGPSSSLGGLFVYDISNPALPVLASVVDEFPSLQGGVVNQEFITDVDSLGLVAVVSLLNEDAISYDTSDAYNPVMLHRQDYGNNNGLSRLRYQTEDVFTFTSYETGIPDSEQYSDAFFRGGEILTGISGGIDKYLNEQGGGDTLISYPTGYDTEGFYGFVTDNHEKSLIVVGPYCE
jgi:hypothetical protein